MNVLLLYDQVGRLKDRFVCKGPATASCSGGTQIYGSDAGWKGSRLVGQSDTALNQGVSLGYDEFNRLSSRTVVAGTAQNYTYTYDLYGNRLTQTPLNGGYSFNPTINTANNHITSSGYAYDAAGNLTNDSVNAYTYDAEGNVIKVVNAGGTSQYVYDVFNRRIHVQRPSGTTEYIYDYAGRRISAWPSPANNVANEGRIYWDGQLLGYRSNDGSTYFEHQDPLGTERMRTTYSGTVGSTYVSLPWGDGYSAKVNASGADQDNNHFAGLERDPESNTEHAQFRNYASAQGRWLAPDPYLGSYDLTNPQTFNRYAYALNNPLSLVDPSGLAWCLASVEGVDFCQSTGPDLSPTFYDGDTISLIDPFSLRLPDQTRGPGGNRPLNAPSKTTCKTGFGGGILVGADAGAGLGFVGAGGNVGAGVGLFGGNGINAGAFASGGVGANFLSHGASAPNANLNGRNFVGAGGGVGGGIFLTNASQASQLSGPFATWNVDLGWAANGAAQFAAGTDSAGNTIWTFSFTLGGGGGFLYHNITTNTVVKGTGKGGC